jgi:tyrosinase
MKRFQSEPLDLPTDRADVKRADLIFYGVDHSGPTYEARVFLDNPRANSETPRTVEEGYAGSFTVFGHGGCFGGDNHCAPVDRHSDEFDRRPPHPLTPQTVAVTVTDALARIQGEQVKVHVVTVLPAGMEKFSGSTEVLACERVRLATYA